MANSFDIIGDIHGHAAELKSLLELMGYREQAGRYAHPARRALFLGDLIDRGPEIPEVLRIVRSMVDSGNAVCLLGNHEYNALAYDTPNRTRRGEFLRSHNDEHLRQHGRTLSAFKDHPEQWREYLNWFMILPLYLDMGFFRAVHAAWDPPSIRHLEARLGGAFLNEDFLHTAAVDGSEDFKAVQNVLKGLEAPLPDGLSYPDKDGHPRRKVRVKWWLEMQPDFDFADISIGLLSAPEEVQKILTGLPVSDAIRRQIPGVSPNASPVFMGHYWMSGKPELISKKVACLDWSVALQGKLAAYRYDGEKLLDNSKLVWVENRR